MKILRQVAMGKDMSGWNVHITDDEMFNHFVIVSKKMRDELTLWMKVASGEENDNT